MRAGVRRVDVFQSKYSFLSDKINLFIPILSRAAAVEPTASTSYKRIKSTT
jgi:hypothetical protein